MKKASRYTDPVGRLVIVESPKKAETLSKFLDKTYSIRATKGHILDLPKNKLGIDIENDFEPDYRAVKGRESILKELRSLASKASETYLASDPDREGEAIAWHVAEKIGVDEKKVHRKIGLSGMQNMYKPGRYVVGNLTIEASNDFTLDTERMEFKKGWYHLERDVQHRLQWRWTKEETFEKLCMPSPP